jgi:hypothetical protein
MKNTDHWVSARFPYLISFHTLISIDTNPKGTGTSVPNVVDRITPISGALACNKGY